MEIILHHAEKGLLTFDSMDVIKFVHDLWSENESKGIETSLERPELILDCLAYIHGYASNVSIISINGQPFNLK